MPSIGTDILSARVKNETIRRFKEAAEACNTTVPKILDALAGVTPDHAGVFEYLFGETEEITEEEMELIYEHRRIQAGNPG